MIADKNKYMELAFDLAYSRMGQTSPNPSVGAVIVKNGDVVSTGCTSEYGKDHAEVNAIKNTSGINLRGTEMYVSLEPCSHFGKTPPCVNSIIETGISKVFIPILDPNPEVAGRGVTALKNAGVEVIFMHDMTSSASDLIRPFKKYILRKKPFILNKSAMTLDGRIADEDGNSKWISSEVSRLIVHRLRTKVDAVIIGKGTYEKDKPALTSRLNDFSKESYLFLGKYNVNLTGRDNFFLKKLISNEDEAFNDIKQPLKIIIGIPAGITGEEDFFNTGNHIIYESKNKGAEYFNKNKDIKNKINIVMTESEGSEQIYEICIDLASKGIMFALLEGGGTLSGSFYESGETDQMMYFISPKIFGSGTGVLNFSSVKKKSEFFKENNFQSNDFSKLQDISAVFLGEDLIYNAYREKYNFEMM
jgi:diaminohydroxyphosphoribosylaminopyrimidine deaminase/5-amino-6-(5-phosphoribosylamino)uracil reductase